MRLLTRGRIPTGRFGHGQGMPLLEPEGMRPVNSGRPTEAPSCVRQQGFIPSR
jgi:hypothetical protein